MLFKYPVELTHYDDEVVVEFPDIPEIISSGRDEMNALENAIDALDEAIAGRINRNEDIPSPSKKRNSKYVAVSIQIALKAAIHIELIRSNINKSQFAIKLGVDEKVARRILDPKYNSQLKKLECALQTLKVNIVVGANTPEEPIMQYTCTHNIKDESEIDQLRPFVLGGNIDNVRTGQESPFLNTFH